MNYLLPLFLLLIATPAFSGEMQDCKILGDKLYNCEKFECFTTSADIPGGKIINKILGYNNEGECSHEQANPNGDKVLCRYSEESRKFIALKLKKAGSDLLGLEEQSELDENIMADIFHNECDVSAAEADDKPKVDENSRTNLDDIEQIETEDGEFMPDHIIPENANLQQPEFDVQDNGDLLDIQ
jgi:hypothetical protein